MKKVINEKVNRLQDQIKVLRREIIRLRKLHPKGNSTEGGGHDLKSKYSKGYIPDGSSIQPTTQPTAPVAKRCNQTTTLTGMRRKKPLNKDGKELKRKAGLLQIRMAGGGDQCHEEDGVVTPITYSTLELQEPQQREQQQQDQEQKQHHPLQLEYLRDQLQRTKMYYERQVASIKCNAQLLECQLRKMQQALQDEMASRSNAFQSCENHYQSILAAVEEMSSHGDQLFGVPSDERMMNMISPVSRSSLSKYSGQDMTFYTQSTIAYIMDNYC